MNENKNAETKCHKNNVGAKTSDLRAGSNNTSFTTTRYKHDNEFTTTNYHYALGKMEHARRFALHVEF